MKGEKQMTKIDKVAEIINERKVIPSKELAELVYGDSSPATVLKLHRLISAYRHRPGRNVNAYCIRGVFFDFTTFTGDFLGKVSKKA